MDASRFQALTIAWIQHRVSMVQRLLALQGEILGSCFLQQPKISPEVLFLGKRGARGIDLKGDYGLTVEG